ncbi:MAG: UDP-glycosyltransferase [Flavobacteriaceae bacterium CG_4_8_14_3_um_filter_34_10]|nr:MAG: UDP-glycosyltransferase [Flavobacteriaceae bacterium CG18_big_fil_WC_8_21_14_2_50_34_36]PIV48882.1 MAG: UDP-glycosyltransferase [Flavobacteriaceae bacterium CG02_land_8_20_14_3_00_34_13]PIX10333.1 MAG: UDP-glycosyltransferase [Flavobacteriaceae bacterium CG_4_8_14_3_um_filter_34_10]PIZ08031.1 MAG: UDP-glycosyltransferase [Flavobacteriaceae bacterium CG_4_10_14_0_8_um_filter_34_31]PJC08015.1 MAG: UDP-glycosyltransferase [Flavobacteriaceae bacterium CG_4_9_14_0_8_um_filter_34_30]
MGVIKKIGVVVDSINVNDSSGSKANVAFILNLNKAGFEVKVFHYTQKEIQLPNIECVAIPEKKLNGLYVLSRMERLFTRWTGLNLNPFLEGFFGFSFTFFNDVASIKKALLKESDFNPDFILTLSKGASFRPHDALLKLPQLHHKWMAYVHDPYPFHYYPRPYNWIQPGYKQKEQFFRAVSEKAKFSAFPSLLLQEWMGSYFENFLKTGVVIPHQNAHFEVKLFDVTSYFDTLKFNLLHAGNLMKQRSPEGLIQGFQLFLKNNPEAKENARLSLIGSASYHEEMLTTYQKKIPELYVCLDNKLFDEVQFLQNNTTVNIILESKSEISPFLPGKFPHCVQANKPILALGPYYSETRRLLGADYPYWSEVNDVENIAKLIEKLYQLWQQDSNKLVLNRIDLKEYVSIDYLKRVINQLHNNQ